MKLSRITIGGLIAAAVLVPAIAPAATSDVLQPQLISLLQKIVTLQQQLIVTLQAEVAQLEAQINSLTGNSFYSQSWPLQQAFTATSPTYPPQFPTAPPQPAPDTTIGGTAAAATTSSASATSGSTQTQTPSSSCLVSTGASYPDGSTVGFNPCPGEVCAAMSNIYLTCHTGRWFLSNGVPYRSIDGQLPTPAW
jgi:hypothetical protein